MRCETQNTELKLIEIKALFGSVSLCLSLSLSVSLSLSRLSFFLSCLSQNVSLEDVKESELNVHSPHDTGGLCLFISVFVNVKAVFVILKTRIVVGLGTQYS
jgi:hypothetical protein